LVLRDFGWALHVLILASEDCRIKQVTANHGLSEKAAGVSKVKDEIGILPPGGY